MKRIVNNLYDEYLEDKLNKIIITKDKKDNKYHVRPEFYAMYPKLRHSRTPYETFFDGENVIRLLCVSKRNGWFCEGIPQFHDELARVRSLDKYSSHCYINNLNQIISPPYFAAHDFKNGTAIVDSCIYYYQIDTKFNTINQYSFFSIDEDYPDGFKKVKVSDSHRVNHFNILTPDNKLLYNDYYKYVGDKHRYPWLVKFRDNYYFQTKTEIRMSPCYKKATDFSEGLAAVESWDDDAFYVNRYFDNPFDKTFSEAFPFKEGIGRVKIIHHWCGMYTYINKRGDYITDSHFYDARDFNEGFAAVKLYNTVSRQWNFIDKKGKPLCNECFDKVYDFKNGYAVVKKDGLYNYIDKEGKCIFNVWFEHATDFENDFAVVTTQGYNIAYIVKTDKGLKIYDFRQMYNFKNGIAIVQNRNCTYSYLKKNGEKLFINNDICDFLHVTDFIDGIAAVETKEGWNLIDLNGNLLFAESIKCNRLYPPVDGMACFEEGFKKHPKFGYVNMDGKVIIPPKRKTSFDNSDNYITLDGEIIPKKIDVGDYTITKTLFGYKCISKSMKFTIKNRPVKLFGDRYFICINKDKITCYDIFDKCEIWSPYNISYDDNFVFVDDEVYFFYNNEFINITNYYNNYLKDKEVVKLTSTDSEILSEDEFKRMNLTTIEELYKQEKEKELKLQEQKRIEEETRLLKQKEFEMNEIRKKNRLERTRILEELKVLLKRLDEVTTPEDTDRIEIDNIFVEVDDHLEINDHLIPYLYHLDLKLYPFENVKMDNIDFSNTQIEFNPQTVYKKNLSNCNFEGVNISPWMDFTGVDIRGAKFSKDNDTKTDDYFNPSFKYAIYDENTTYNGQPISEVIIKEGNKYNKKRNLSL